jgi:hypothetical protein
MPGRRGHDSCSPAAGRNRRCVRRLAGGSWPAACPPHARRPVPRRAFFRTGRFGCEAPRAGAAGPSPSGGRSLRRARLRVPVLPVTAFQAVARLSAEWWIRTTAIATGALPIPWRDTRRPTVGRARVKAGRSPCGQGPSVSRAPRVRVGPDVRSRRLTTLLQIQNKSPGGLRPPGLYPFQNDWRLLHPGGPAGAITPRLSVDLRPSINAPGSATDGQRTARPDWPRRLRRCSVHCVISVGPPEISTISASVRGQHTARRTAVKEKSAPPATNCVLERRRQLGPEPSSAAVIGVGSAAPRRGKCPRVWHGYGWRATRIGLNPGAGGINRGAHALTSARGIQAAQEG